MVDNYEQFDCIREFDSNPTLRFTELFQKERPSYRNKILQYYPSVSSVSNYLKVVSFF